MPDGTAKSRILGFAFLFQAVTALVSGLVFRHLWEVGDDVGAALTRIADNSLAARAGILLDMATACGVIFLGAVLLVTLRKQGEILAFTGFGLYVLDAALVAAGRSDVFSLIRMSEDYAESGHPAAMLSSAKVASEAAAFTSLTLSMVAFCVGATAFYWLLLRSRIIPTTLALWGLIGVALCAIGTVLTVLGFTPVIYIYLLYAPFEFVIGVWIIVRGVRPDPGDGLPDRDKPAILGVLAS